MKAKHLLDTINNTIGTELFAAIVGHGDVAQIERAMWRFLGVDKVNLKDWMAKVDSLITPVYELDGDCVQISIYDNSYEAPSLEDIRDVKETIKTIKVWERVQVEKQVKTYE